MPPTISYDGPSELSANQLFSAVFRFTADRPLRPGARVLIAVRHVSDFGDPQTDDPRAENYVSIIGPRDDITWKLGPLNDWPRIPWNRGIDLHLVSGEILPGETLIITVGDTSQGSPGYRAQSFVESQFRFRLGIDALGDGRWTILPQAECPVVQIVGNRPTTLRVVVPQATSRDEHAVAIVKAEDAYGNIAGESPGEVTLLLDDSVPIGRTYMNPAEVCVKLPRDDKWHTITAVSDDGTFFARSNPFGPSPLARLNLYFGDLHVMSGHCCGTGSAQEQYKYAREVSGLDFAAVTSFDCLMADQDWEEIQQATRKANDPGRFVTFLAYEWGGSSDIGGDHCIYFPGDEGRLVRSGSCEDSPWNPAAGAIGGPPNLADAIRLLCELRPMVIPHCGGRQANLDFFDSDVMPMLEIHSTHRTFENMGFEAIRRGIKCGFIANSDDHRGTPGDGRPTARERYFSTPGGLTAVYAEKLTRESLWEAFFARRVYATNGERIVLATSIGDAFMGEEVSAPSGTTLRFSLRLRSDGFLDRVELMKEDQCIYVFTGQWNLTHEFAEEWEIEVEPGAHAYWVRVFQTDGGRAWSSPIWVNGGKETSKPPPSYLF